MGNNIFWSFKIGGRRGFLWHVVILIINVVVVVVVLLRDTPLKCQISFSIRLYIHNYFLTILSVAGKITFQQWNLKNYQEIKEFTCTLISLLKFQNVQKQQSFTYNLITEWKLWQNFSQCDGVPVLFECHNLLIFKYTANGNWIYKNVEKTSLKKNPLL